MKSFTAIVTCIGLSHLGAPARAEIVARQPYPKQNLNPPAEGKFELVVKFLDELKVRAATDGSLFSKSGADMGAVLAAAKQLGLTFSQHVDIAEEKLRDLELGAETTSNEAQPDLAGFILVRSDDNTNASLAAIGMDLQELAEVEFADLVPLDVELSACPDPADPMPCTSNMVSTQVYRGPDPGMEMDYAWAQGSAKGQGIRFSEVEYGWWALHEDLVGTPVIPEPGHTPCADTQSNYDHGTAMIGVTAATKNAFGCTGLAPDAEIHTYPACSTQAGNRLPSALVNAINDSGQGGVVLVGLGNTNGAPLETALTYFNYVKTGVLAGRIIVLPAGNGYQNLDDLAYTTYRSWGDSGAIIVGGGVSHNVNHMMFPAMSSYGARINVHGWAQGVSTLGYFPIPGTGDKNQSYIAGFTGTSSASAMVGGVCVALQSYAVNRLCRRLTPNEMRSLLISSGRPQYNNPAIEDPEPHIGPYPNMREAIRQIHLMCSSSCRFRRGDANGDGVVDVSDGVRIGQWFTGSGVITCLEAANANNDASLDLADWSTITNWLFLGGPQPPSPGPFSCGPDVCTSEYNLGCTSYAPACP